MDSNASTVSWETVESNNTSMDNEEAGAVSMDSNAGLHSTSSTASLVIDRETMDNMNSMFDGSESNGAPTRPTDFWQEVKQLLLDLGLWHQPDGSLKCHTRAQLRAFFRELAAQQEGNSTRSARSRGVVLTCQLHVRQQPPCSPEVDAAPSQCCPRYPCADMLALLHAGGRLKACL